MSGQQPSKRLSWEEIMANVAQSVNPESQGSRALTALLSFSPALAKECLHPAYWKELHDMRFSPSIPIRQTFNPPKRSLILWRDDLDEDEKPGPYSDTEPSSS